MNNHFRVLYKNSQLNTSLHHFFVRKTILHYRLLSYNKKKSQKKIQSVVLKNIASFLEHWFKVLEHEMLSSRKAICFKVKDIINLNNAFDSDEQSTYYQEKQKHHRRCS